MKHASLLLGSALLTALVSLPIWGSDYALLVGYRVLEAAALAQAFNLLAGYGGLVSLGNAAFIGIGAYTTAVVSLRLGVALLPSLLVAGAAAAAFAFVVSPALFRLRGLYYTIATLSLAEGLRIWMVNWNGLGGATGLFLTDATPPLSHLYGMALGLALVSTAVVTGVLRTRLGIALRAVRDDEDSAREMGLSTFRTKLWAFMVASFLMGAVGGLHAGKLSAIEPYGSFTLHWTIDLVNITIIGGLGTRVGPLLGAVFIVLLGEALASYPELHIALTGVILIAAIRFAPQGIWGLLHTLVARASKHRQAKVA